MLHTALPNLSENGRALLSVLGCLNGHSPHSGELAGWLGFHDRYQLARALRREGLPPLEVVGGWARTLYWMTEAEASGKSLRELAEREHLDPAVAYRLVRRVTGQRWSEVRREGLAATILRFRARCAREARRQGASAAELSRAPLPLPPLPREGGWARAQWREPAARSGTMPRAPGHGVVQSISERVTVEASPFDVTFSRQDEALVTCGHAAAVSVLQLKPLRVAATLHVGPAPTRVIADRRPSAGTRVAYVTTQFVEAVSVLDLDRRRRIGSIPVPGHPLGAVLSPDGHTLYVTTNTDHLIAISTIQRAVIGTTAVPYGIPQLAIHPSGRWLLAPGWRSGVIAEVSTATLAVTRRFQVGGVVQDVVVSPDGQTLYAANESGWLDVIHLPTGRRTATVDLGTSALGLALSADATDLYVGLLDAGRVLVLQRQGLVERASVAVGGRPRLIAAHPDGDGVLVANEAGWVDLLR